MANLAISELHPAELENEIIALTDGEQASIQGGLSFSFSAKKPYPGPGGYKKIRKWFKSLF